ncbi:MAG: ribonucleoside reductase [Alphaproteobacteria bacterium]|nr:ribonucleoside reductase [Alphaproteobacteria bacterium]
MPTVSAIAQQIWDMKYRFKAPDGTPLDESIEDSWQRVAGALAEAEQDPAAWAQTFREALEDFRFLPAGRILAGAGTGRDVTLFNCFVMGEIPDDMTGIFEHLKEAALTLQRGGGIGYDFSTLRPRGAPVHGVGADASGPLSFMDVWDAMCRTIMSAGYRRGAMMGTLRCDHPDIRDFVHAKAEPGRLRMFNLSVLVTDDFMTAVREDADWPLVFGGKTFSTLRARDLWNEIMRATYDYAEPGVIFIDRINHFNNLRYIEEIYSTNPCITADSWIHTADGPRQVRDLVGSPFVARVSGENWPSAPEGFFATGEKKVLRLTTREGHALRLTPDHPVARVSHSTRYRTNWDWCPAGDLQPGDRIILNNHAAETNWPGPHTLDEGYLIGLLLGDGTIKTDKTVLSVWPGRVTACGSWERPGVAAMMERAQTAAHRFPHRSDFAGWIKVQGRGEYRMALAALKVFVENLGLAPGAKTITPEMEKASANFQRGLLQGLFDADGSIQGTQTKGVSVRLAQSNLKLLAAVQRILLRLCITSKIYAERRAAGPRRLPDGKGGYAVYDCAADHELIISGSSLQTFLDRIGFTDSEKATRLSALLSGYRRRLNRARFDAVVENISEDGVAPVFDVRIPGVNAFDANGLLVHNCGEQPLPPYGACLLGSINLARLVREPFTKKARLDVEAMERLIPTALRMMDDAIDVSRFALEKQREEAVNKRRVGLGVTGLGDALIMCRVAYGGAKAVKLTETWMAAFRNAAYRASIELAREKGPFPLFDRDKYMAGATIATLPADIRDAIAEHGIRNALVTSIAPTGTISLLADNVSSGIEPVFTYRFTRALLMPDGSHRDREVVDYAAAAWWAEHGEEADLPDYFVDSRTLAPEAHIVMQAAVQKYIDSSISKTVNLPDDIPFEDFKDVYLKAYDMGCKGCTTYRPNLVTGAVLTADEKGQEPVAKVVDEHESASDIVYMTQPLERPEALVGKTYKLRWPESDHAFYLTVNDIIQDGRRRPFEVFINSANLEHYAWTVALTRMISAVFRRGGDVTFVVRELKSIFDPRGGYWMEGRYVPSLLAALGEVMEQHMIDIGFISEPESEMRESLQEAVGESPARFCPKCSQPGLVRREGCDLCLSCGYSKCS